MALQHRAPAERELQRGKESVHRIQDSVQIFLTDFRTVVLGPY
jgi:hypothetical protein